MKRAPFSGPGAGLRLGGSPPPEPPTDHPDLESIAAYVDGRLNDRARTRITEHLASCEDCYAIFTESAQTRVEAVTKTESIFDRLPRWMTGPRLAWSTAGAALATAASVWLVVVGRGVSSTPRMQPELRALAAALAAGNDRPVEGRLSGGFAYAPVRGPVRAAAPSMRVVSPDVRIAAAQIEKAAAANRTPLSLRVLALAYLALGDVTRAVPVLEEAVDQPAPDPQAQSDLAAAYLARAAQNDQAQDLTKALTMSDRAVKADRRLAEAWFNRAYALERLSLIDQARQAWQDYLKIDSQSGWATEAREHVRALGGVPQSRDTREQEAIAEAARRRDAVEIAKLVRRSPDLAREWTQNLLLADWSSAAIDGNAAAADILAAAEFVAGELTNATGDRFMADAVAAAAAASRTRDQAAALGSAQRSWRAAFADYNEDRVGESVSQFQTTVEPLEKSASPFAAWARLQLAIGEYYARDYSVAKRELDLVIENAHRRSHHRLEGLAHRVRGLIEVVTGQFAAGWDEYRSAATYFDRAGDVDNLASIQALIAEDLGFLGETQLAWSAFSEGLSRLSVVRERRHRHTILQDAALASLRDGFPESALYFQQATLDNATAWGRPLAIVNAYMFQGEMQRQVGNTELAVSSLRQARAVLSTISDAELVARDEALIQLAEGEVEWRARPAEAVASLSRALAIFERTKTSWPLVRVRLARGRAHLAAGHDDLAEADFAAGIDVFESQRAAVSSEALRSASFERPWDLYSEMIRFQAVNRRRPDRALAFAERARARTLLEALSPGGASAALDPVSARAALPPAVTMLYYAALDDRLLIWSLTRERLDFADTPVRHADIQHLLDEYRSDMAGPTLPPRDTTSLTKLYDVLIRPVAHLVPEGSLVVVVPDGALHAVPFAALLRREGRRYLVEDHALVVAPSLTIFLSAAARQTTPAVDWRRALVMGNPRATRGPEPELPEAEAEARAVAALYSAPTLLLGDRATKTDFIARAGRSDVVHFAGHAIANDGRPELSRLLLAGSDEASRSLFARDIAGQSFPSTKLVVLGACRTSAGRIRRGEGVFSLARPFLAAGVPTVVASLWDIDDRVSRRLLVAFHRALPRSANVAEALRRAQLELMGDVDPRLQMPAAWAAFTTIGGSAAPGDRPES